VILQNGYCEFCIASDDGEDENEVIVVSEDEDDDDNCNYGRDDDNQDDEDDPWHFDRGNNLALLAASIPFCPNNNETTEGST